MLGKSGLILILALNSSLAWGFGMNGHRVIGTLAEQHLSYTARAEVTALLDGESMAFASTWADEMRSNPDNPDFWGYDYSANWHFVNVPEGASYNPATASDLGDAYTALTAFIAILRGEPLAAGPVKEGLEFYFGDLDNGEYRPEIRKFALRFLLHIAGDLHQPLHVGHAEDLGGNQIQVRWFGDRTNLHTVWDTRLVEFQDLSFSELSLKLQEKVAVMEQQEINLIQRATALQWIEEGLQLRREAYDVERFDSDLGYSYTFTYVPLIEQQMLKAGLRLAELLNGIFSTP